MYNEISILLREYDIINYADGQYGVFKLRTIDTLGILNALQNIFSSPEQKDLILAHIIANSDKVKDILDIGSTPKEKGKVLDVIKDSFINKTPEAIIIVISRLINILVESNPPIKIAKEVLDIIAGLINK